MAKKKSKTAKKTKSSTQKVSRRLSAAKKKSTKKSGSKGRKKTSAKKSSAKKRKSPSKKKNVDSVDNILKKFVEERSSLDVHLEALEKKIAGLEMKTKMYQEQLVALAQDKDATLDSIAKIDTRRDLEVSQMLAKLGVKVTEVVPPAATTTVVFDVKPAEETANGDHRSVREDRYSNEDE